MAHFGSRIDGRNQWKNPCLPSFWTISAAGFADMAEFADCAAIG